MAEQEPSRPSPDSTPTAQQPDAGWYPNPVGSGRLYWDGGKWTARYADRRGKVLDIPPPPATAAARGGDSLVPIAYLLAVLPLIGLLIGLSFGIVLLARRNRRGAGVIAVSIVAFLLWAVLLTPAG